MSLQAINNTCGAVGRGGAKAFHQRFRGIARAVADRSFNLFKRQFALRKKQGKFPDFLLGGEKIPFHEIGKGFKHIAGGRLAISAHASGEPLRQLRALHGIALDNSGGFDERLPPGGLLPLPVWTRHRKKRHHAVDRALYKFGERFIAFDAGTT